MLDFLAGIVVGALCAFGGVGLLAAMILAAMRDGLSRMLL